MAGLCEATAGGGRSAGGRRRRELRVRDGRAEPGSFLSARWTAVRRSRARPRPATRNAEEGLCGVGQPPGPGVLV